MDQGSRKQDLPFSFPPESLGPRRNSIYRTQNESVKEQTGNLLAQGFFPLCGLAEYPYSFLMGDMPEQMWEPDP